MEPERPLTMPCERVESVSQAVSLGAPTVSREQSCRTILIREPHKGSSLSDDKLSDKAIHPACAPFLASSQRADLQGRNGPQTPSQVIQKIPAPEIQSLPGQVQMTCPEASPSSAEPGPIPTPSGLKSSPLNITHGFHLARKPVMEWSKPSTSVSKTVSSDAISRFLPRHSVCVKPLEQPSMAVLHTELPRGSSLMGIEPSSWINSAPVSLISMNVHVRKAAAQDAVLSE